MAQSWRPAPIDQQRQFALLWFTMKWLLLALALAAAKPSNYTRHFYQLR
jgi:hypothetical protein